MVKIIQNLSFYMILIGLLNFHNIPLPIQYSIIILVDMINPHLAGWNLNIIDDSALN